MKAAVKSILIILSIVAAIALLFFAIQVMPEGEFALALTLGACLVLLFALGIIMVIDGIWGIKTPESAQKAVLSDSRTVKIIGGITIALLSALAFYFGIFR